MNPALQAMLRIAQQHYGGNIQTGRGRTWIDRLAQNPEFRKPVAQRLIAQLGLSQSPRDVFAIKH